MTVAVLVAANPAAPVTAMVDIHGISSDGRPRKGTVAFLNGEQFPVMPEAEERAIGERHKARSDLA